MWLEESGQGNTKIKAGFRLTGFLRPIERVVAGILPELYFPFRYLAYKLKGGNINIKVKAEEVNRLVKDLVRAKKEEDSPFFIWIHYMDVHGPYLPYLTYASDKPLSYRETVVKSFPSFLQSRFFKKFAKRFVKKYLKNTIDTYDQGIKYVDKKIGELFDFLRLEDIYQDSIIFLAGDHGDEFMEHGESSHNNKLYNELLHVPLLIKNPGDSCQTIDKKISLIDLSPTLCFLARVEPSPSFKGKNLFGSEISEVFHQAVSPKVKGIKHDADIKDAKYTMVGYQSDSWKYILDHATGREELYSLINDKGEKTNVAGVRQDMILEMRKKVAEFEKKNPPLNG